MKPSALFPADGAVDDKLGAQRQVAQFEQVRIQDKIPVELFDLLPDKGDPVFRSYPPS